MEKKYSIETLNKIVTVRFFEEPTILDIKNAIGEIDDQQQNNLRLWDLSQARLNLSNAELHELAVFAKTKLQQPAKVAVVVSDDLSFGVSRVYETFRGNQEIDIRVFRDQQEGLNWLEKPSKQGKSD